MARKVIWTERAWNDLEDIADHIVKDSPHYAATLVREVRDAARSLAPLAERGRIVPELHDPDIRELLVRNYRLIYEITDQDVYVLGVVHGARDLWTLWEREE